MYCSNCGAEASQGLRFCKRCGANLYNTADLAGPAVPQRRITGAIWALAFATIAFGLGGLGIVFGIVASLAGAVNPGKGLLVPMVVLGSATVFGIIAMLIRLVFRLIGDDSIAKAQRQPLPFLKGRAADFGQQQLGPPPRVIGSVTEQTTRSFDPAILEQKERNKQ